MIERGEETATRRPSGWSSKDQWQRALYVACTILAWLAIAIIGLWLLGHVAKTVLTLILSGVLAFALTPLVTLLSRWMPRGFAIAAAYTLGFAVILGLGALLVITAANQVTNLVGNLPTYQQQLHNLQPQIVRVLRPFGVTNANYSNTEHQLVAYLQSQGTALANDSLGIVTGILGTLVDIVLVLILSIYLTANGPKVAAWLRRETPGAQRRHTNVLIAIVNQVLGGYVRGTLTLAALIGVLVGLGMLILRVPYAVLLGVLAFFMEFIPIVGVLVSGAVCVVVALFQGWITAVLVLGYFVIVHVIEGDVVGPRIMAHAVGIHPAVALIGLVAGTELFGFWGALFAAPLAGLVQAVATVVWRELRHGPAKQVLKAVAAEQAEKTRDETPDETPAAPVGT